MERASENEQPIGEVLTHLFIDHIKTSTIGGLVYLTIKNQSKWSKAFWASVVSFGMIISLVWSISTYTFWENNPVITTIFSPGNFSKIFLLVLLQSALTSISCFQVYPSKRFHFQRLQFVQMVSGHFLWVKF